MSSQRLKIKVLVGGNPRFQGSFLSSFSLILFFTLVILIFFCIRGNASIKYGEESIH